MRSKVVSLLKKPMTGIIISVFVGFIVGAKTEICFADHHQRDPDHSDRLERIICL